MTKQDLIKILLKKIDLRYAYLTSVDDFNYEIVFKTEKDKVDYVKSTRTWLHSKCRYKGSHPLIEGDDWLVNGYKTGLKYNATFSMLFIFRLYDSDLILKSYNNSTRLSIY